MGNIKIYTSVIQGGYVKMECDNDPLSILSINIELPMPLIVGYSVLNENTSIKLHVLQ